MPRLDLLLLPLLAGYIFLVTFNLTKYYHIRLERQRLIYHSLGSAFLLAALGYLFDFWILRSDFRINLGFIQTSHISHYRQEMSLFVDQVLNNNHVSGLKHSILILVISWPLAKFLNILFPRKFAFDYTIQRWGNQLERLIWFSLTEKNDEDKLLMITTKSNKVYIGYVNKLSEPIGEAYITMLPNFSGYRNKETLKLEITTTYTDVIEKYIKENRAAEIGQKLGVLLPVSEILIVSKFDNEIFSRFNSNVESNTENESTMLNRFIRFIKKLK